MRRGLLLIMILLILVLPVHAADLEPPEVPESAQPYMPEETENFGEGLWYVIRSALRELEPQFVKAAKVCLSVIAVTLLTALLLTIKGEISEVVELTGAVSIGVLLLQPANVLVQLGVETISELSNYGNLLLPVMTTALAAQGGVTSSTALYAGTALFNTVLSNLISHLLVPILYIFLCVSVGYAAVGDTILEKIRKFSKWLITWSLKIILYVFTGYMGLTGVVSGSTDAAALKATKLTISGVVPVVGGILSDASEAILVGASLVKNAVGVYGLLALIAIWIKPFVQIGVQYLMLKGTAAICAGIGSKRVCGIIDDFAAGMGLILAMTGTTCLLLLISIVCFLKGIL